MPTNRPRHTLTETEDIRDALAAARRRWPEERAPSRLLVRLIMAGRDTLGAADRRARDDRLRALDRTEGALSGCYETAEHERLRDEWPA